MRSLRARISEPEVLVHLEFDRLEEFERDKQFADVISARSRTDAL